MAAGTSERICHGAARNRTVVGYDRSRISHSSLPHRSHIATLIWAALVPPTFIATCFSALCRCIQWAALAAPCLSSRSGRLQGRWFRWCIGNLNSIPAVKLLSGWWVTYPSEKYEFVSWDDDSSQYMGNYIIHIHQCSSHHQSVIIF